MSAVSLDLTPKGSVEIETLVNGPIQTNSYAVISDNECVIIDPAWEGERLVEHIRAEHPGVRLFGAVCTHGHADHVGGVVGVRTTVGNALYELCAKDAAVPHANIEEQRAMWGIETPDPGEPTRLLAEGDAIKVGDIYLQVIETPGHTPGGIVLFAATEQGNIAFVGDTLFPGGHGRTDLSGGDEAAILRSHQLARLLRPIPFA